MQKLIGTMRVGLRPKHAAHHHLRFGKTGAEQFHERDRAALADIADRRLKVRLTGAVERLFKPGRGAWCIPSTRGAF